MALTLGPERMGLRQDKYMTKSYIWRRAGEEKEATGRLPRAHEDTDSLQLLEELAVRWGPRCHGTWPAPLYASLLTGPPPHQEPLLIFLSSQILLWWAQELFTWIPFTTLPMQCRNAHRQQSWPLGVGSLLPLGTEFRLPGLCGMACRKVCRAFSSLTINTGGPSLMGSGATSGQVILGGIGKPLRRP